MRAATATRPGAPAAAPAPSDTRVVALDRPTFGPVQARGPRRLWLTGLIMVLVIVVCATIAAVSVARRTAALGNLVNPTEPLATAAENLYASLSQADAAAASAFLAGGIESAADRATYQQAVADAGAALGTAASGMTADSPDATRSAITALVTQLPVYTGVVDTARANNRLGLPVGAAYLRQASNLMRSTLLPAASTLYAEQSQAVTDAQNDAGGLPVTALIMAVIILLVLLAGTLVLSRATRRRLNLGVAVALLATVGWLGWLIVAGSSAATHLKQSNSDGSTPLSHLVAARILAQQARTDEKLYLIARGSGSANEKDFSAHGQQLTALLDQAGNPAGVDMSELDAAAKTWVDGHTKMFSTGDGGNYPDAVTLSTGTLDQQFAQLDQQLRTAVDTVRQTLRTQAQLGNSALAGLTTGILVLGALGVLAIAIGLAPRLREYQ